MKPGHSCFIDIPLREKKPRRTGLTILIDGGLSTQLFTDVIESHSVFIDFVKFGWCTAIVTAKLRRKLEVLRHHNVRFFFGGTLFEKAVSQKKIKEFYSYLNGCQCEYVEIANGTIALSNSEKCEYIRHAARSFRVFSEVGYKDHERSDKMYPQRWITYIKEDLEAGAEKVITEARETGRSGICRSNGELRYGLIEEILNSGIDIQQLIFEAPNKYLQAHFIKRLGANVNMANISFHDIIGLETLRLGLHADTF